MISKRPVTFVAGVVVVAAISTGIATARGSHRGARSHRLEQAAAVVWFASPQPVVIPGAHGVPVPDNGPAAATLAGLRAPAGSQPPPPLPPGR
jgi:hypothetical protein